MTKDEFLALGKDIEGFRILNPEKAPPRLTAKILWDLWDIGVKFGSFGPKGLEFGAGDLRLELYNFAQKGGANGFFVAKIRGSIAATVEGAIFLKLRNGMDVIWDRSFSVKDIENRIELIDDAARQKGLKVGDSRLVFTSEEVKTSVEQIFGNKNETKTRLIY